MIEVKNLSVTFDGLPVLNRMTAGFEEGAVHGIVGLNGAGKTTFFNVMAAMLKPSAGQILRQGAPLNRKAIAYLETANFFYAGITGSEYLKIFRQTNHNFELAVLQAYCKLPLDSLVQHYSTGMKKKLAVLALLKQDASVYLLDEPFNGLDMEANKMMEIIIDTLRRKGKTIFVSSHLIDPLLTGCNRIHLLEAGTFTQTFEPADFGKIDGMLFSEWKVRAANDISAAI